EVVETSVVLRKLRRSSLLFITFIVERTQLSGHPPSRPLFDPTKSIDSFIGSMIQRTPYIFPRLWLVAHCPRANKSGSGRRCFYRRAQRDSLPPCRATSRNHAGRRGLRQTNRNPGHATRWGEVDFFDDRQLQRRR